MSDEKGLLAAIWEHPHDDTPRLVYADWLQENGQPERAEFIRVQCELDRIGEWDDGFAALKAREQSLLDAHAAGWRAKIPKKWAASPFHRGFLRLDLSKVPFEKLIQLTARQLRLAPLARYHYNLRGPDIDAFLNWPGAVFQELFAPRTPAPDGWVDRAAACDRLRNVSEIAVICEMREVLTADQVRVLLDAWADRHLTTFYLRAGVRDKAARGTDDDTAELVAGHPAVAKVRRLVLRDARPTVAGLRALGGSPRVGSVRELDLQGTEVGDAGVAELTRSPLLPSLQKLSLSSTGVGDEGVTALANSPAVANLRALNLYTTHRIGPTNRIGPDGFRALARSPYLGRLVYLDIPVEPGRNNAEAVKELTDRFGHLPHFRV